MLSTMKKVMQMRTMEINTVVHTEMKKIRRMVKMRKINTVVKIRKIKLVLETSAMADFENNKGIDDEDNVD